MSSRLRRSIARANRPLNPGDLFIPSGVGFIGESAFSNLYDTYLQAANITAYADAVGFVKNTLPATDKFLILSGASTVYASAPDEAALRVTGSIDLRAYIVLRDWTPAAEQAICGRWTTSANFSYVFGVTATTGTLRFAYSATGAAAGIKLSTSSVAPAVADGNGIWVRVTYNSATGKVNYYTAPEGPTGTPTWALLGTEQTIDAGSIFAGTGILRVGSYDSGIGLAGKFYHAQVYNGIAGTKVFDLTPNSYVSGSTYTCGTGQTVTLQGIAIIVPNELQFYQPTSAARPTAASWPKTGIFNLLAAGGITSEAFGGADWTKTGVSVVDNTDGVFATFTETTANSAHSPVSAATLSFVSGERYATFFDFKPGSDTYYQIMFSGTSFGADAWATFNNVTHAFTANVGVAVTATSITLNADGSYRVGIEAIATASSASVSGGFLAFCDNADAATRRPSYVGNTNSTMVVSRAFIGKGTLTALLDKYQKVTSANLVEQSGVPNVSGVRGDGTDDFLNSGVTTIGDSHFFAAAGQGCCIAIPLIMLPGASGTIFAKCGATDAVKQLQAHVIAAGTLEFVIRGTTNTRPQTVADGRPHYLIYNQNGATVTYMFDGLTETALTVGAAAEEILETFTLFARTISSPAFHGRFRLGLDDLVVINRSLTLAERQQLMQNAANNFGVTLS